MPAWGTVFQNTPPPRVLKAMKEEDQEPNLESVFKTGIKTQHAIYVTIVCGCLLPPKHSWATETGSIFSP